MVAQGQLVVAPPAALPSPAAAAAALTKESIQYQIQQYEKIIQFRDAVLAGSHPKVKPPQHLLNSLTAATQSSLFPHPQNHQTSNSQSFAANSQRPAVPGLGMSAPSAGSNATPKPFGSRSTEINPIFLEKSDDLIKAEAHLQRQRFDRSLKEEIDQRRIAQKTNAQSEPLPDFDVHDVLAKAQTLVKATTAPAVSAAGAGANNTAASDSFDENSYYSSQLNSPDTSRRSSQAERASVGGSVTELPQTRLAPGGSAKGKGPAAPVSQFASYAQYQPTTHQHQGPVPTFPPPQPTSSQFIPGFSSSSFPHNIPHPDNTATDNTTAGESTSLGERSGEASRPDSGNRMDVDPSAGRSVPHHEQSRLEDSLFARPPSPLVIAQDLAPIAPQPSHVSPLATARQQPQHAIGVPQGTNAQVAALRTEPTVVSSPDSSPRGAKRNDKKKNKKKVGKEKRPAAQAPDVPYIKPEPQSPSPVTAPQFARPQKRQKRQSDHEAAQPAPERQPSRQYGGEYAPTSAPAYPGPGYYAPRPESRAVAPNAYGYAPEYVGDRRVSGSAQPYPVQYAPSEHYGGLPPAPAPVSVYEKEPQRVYRDPYDAPRMSARPEHIRAQSRSPMGPPAGPAMRVVVDASGRRYYEPPLPPAPPAAAYQQPVPPPMRADEPEILYERPVRGESRRPEYAEGGVIYRTEPAPYAAPRRIVTQPEYAVPDPHRIYREHEYAGRPMPPPPAEHYVQVRAGDERRPAEEMPHYAMRATTARPAEPAPRYEMPVEYERVQSMRPEYAPHPYPAPPHGEIRREVVQPVPRAYSVRPAEPQLAPRREFSVRPAEAYYAQPVRPGEEVTYIEHPRGVTHEIAYDDGRREYR